MQRGTEAVWVGVMGGAYGGMERISSALPRTVSRTDCRTRRLWILGDHTVFGARTKDMEAVLGASLTRRAEVMRMPTIEQRLASAERELRYLSEFLVKVLSDAEQLPSLQALESQFTEGLKLVVRIRALKDAQSAARKEGKE